MTIELPANRTVAFAGKPANGRYPAVAASGGGGSGSWTEGQEPSITSVSGSFTSGQQATISVSNVSAKRSGQLDFINFEGESVGSKTTSIAQEDVAPDYLIDDANPLFGTRCAKCYADQESLGVAAVLLGQHYPEVFFEAWTWLDRIDFVDPADAQVKLWRLVPGLTLGESAQGPDPGIYSIIESGNGFTISANPDVIAGIWYGSFPGDEAWTRYSGYLKVGTANVADGKRYFKCGGSENFTYSGSPTPPEEGGHFASPNGVVPPEAWDGEDMVTNDGNLDAPGIARLMVPYYTRDGQTTDSRIDRIYINDSPERVVVGDNPDFLLCDPNKTFILPQVSRDEVNEEVVVDIDAVGPLETGAVYVFVFNQDGLYNSTGYEWRAA